MKLIAVECKVLDEETGMEGVTLLPVEEFAQMLFGGAPDNVAVETESTVLAAVEGAEAVTRVVPREAVEEIVKAKTRGEVFEKVAALLVPYGITIAEA